MMKQNLNRGAVFKLPQIDKKVEGSVSGRRQPLGVVHLNPLKKARPNVVESTNTQDTDAASHEHVVAKENLPPKDTNLRMSLNSTETEDILYSISQNATDPLLSEVGDLLLNSGKKTFV